MKIVSALLLLALFQPALPAGWDSYGNARFGYFIYYPAKLMKPLPEAGNGDGRHFKPFSGKADFAAWGEFVDDDATFTANAKYPEADCVGGKATYKLMKPTMWVISCPMTKGGILYSKAYHHLHAESHFEARYPQNERSTWDPVVTRMADSLSEPVPFTLKTN